VYLREDLRLRYAVGSIRLDSVFAASQRTQDAMQSFTRATFDLVPVGDIEAV
jgi:hypothetical protein